MQNLSESLFKDLLFPVLDNRSLVRLGSTNHFFNKITKSQLIHRLEAPLEIIIPSEDCLFLLRGGRVWVHSSKVYGELELVDIKKVVASEGHTIFLKKDGSVWVYGCNLSNQIGLEDKKEISIPVPIPGLVDIKVIAVATNTYHSVFLTEEGTVWVCGSNSCGQLGLGWGREKNSQPVPIPELTRVKAVAAGLLHTLFLMKDGTVIACGSNEKGQLGLDKNQAGVIPKLASIPGLTGVKSIATSANHSLFLKEDGTVWACGSNESGQLGLLGERECKYIPEQIPGLKSVKSIATSTTHTLFLMEDGTVLVCGSNQFGQIGLGYQKTSMEAIPIPELTNVKNVFTNTIQTVFLKEDGSLWVSGSYLEKFFKDSNFEEITRPTKSTAFSWEKDLKRLKELKKEVEKSKEIPINGNKDVETPHP